VILGSGSAVGTFADKNVGTGKTVTASGFALSGADSANYTLSQPAGLSANITAASLGVSGVSANNKVYDASNAATLNVGSAALSGLLGSDAVTLNSGSASGTFADKNVGTGKTVTASGFALSGSDAANYTLNQPTGVSASISKAALTVSGVVVSDKVYDGTQTASVDASGATVSGLLGTDHVALVSAGISGLFADKNVGDGKNVSVSGFSLSGADAGNYDVAPTSAIAGISRKNMTYQVADSTSASGSPQWSPVAWQGLVSGDRISAVNELADENGNVVALNASTPMGTYTQRVVGLVGTDAGNYALLQSGSLFGRLTLGDPVPQQTPVVPQTTKPQAPNPDVMRMVTEWYKSDLPIQAQTFRLEGLRLQDFTLEKGLERNLILIQDSPDGKIVRVLKIAQETAFEIELTN